MSATATSKFVREWGEAFLSFRFSVRALSSSLNLLVDETRIDKDKLMSDIDLLNFLVRYDDEYTRKISRLSLCFLVIPPTSIMCQLLEVIAKMPELYHLEITGPTRQQPKLFPVAALSSFFQYAKGITEFCQNAALDNDEEGFLSLAAALKRCSALTSFECNWDWDPEVEGSHPPWRPQPNSPQSMELSVWEPVIATLLAKHTTDVYIGSNEPYTKALTEESCKQIAKIMEEDGERCFFVEGLRLRLSNTDELLAFCLDSGRSMKVNIYVDFFGAATPPGTFLRSLEDRTKLQMKRFSIKRERRFQSRWILGPDEIDVELSDNSTADPAKIHTLLRRQFPQDTVSLVDDDIQQQYLYQRFHRHDLLQFDPGKASTEQWIQLLTVLGGLSQDCRLEGVEFDLSALYSIMLEYHDKFPGLLLS